MNERAEEIRKQVIELWSKTVNHLEDISKNLMDSGVSMFKVEQAKLLAERDKLINRLGQETYKLIDNGKIKVPKTVSQTYVKIRSVMDRLMLPGKASKRPARKTAKRASARKAK